MKNSIKKLWVLVPFFFLFIVSCGNPPQTNNKVAQFVVSTRESGDSNVFNLLAYKNGVYESVLSGVTNGLEVVSYGRSNGNPIFVFNSTFDFLNVAQSISGLNSSKSLKWGPLESNIVSISSDGYNWSQVNSPCESGYTFYAMFAPGNVNNVLLGKCGLATVNGIVAKLLISNDSGHTWVNPFSTAYESDVTNLFLVNGKYISITSFNATNVNDMTAQMYNVSTKSWSTPESLVIIGGDTASTPAFINTVTNGKILVAMVNNQFYNSSDGVHWITGESTGFSAPTQIFAVDYLPASNLFYFTNESNNIKTSSDGMIWKNLANINFTRESNPLFYFVGFRLFYLSGLAYSPNLGYLNSHFWSESSFINNASIESFPVFTPFIKQPESIGVLTPLGLTASY